MRLIDTLKVGALSLALAVAAQTARAADEAGASGSVVQKIEATASGAAAAADPHACCNGAEKAGLVCGMCTPDAKAAVGKPAVNFQLSDVEGKKVMLSDYAGKVVVLNWVSNSCPFMVDLYKRNDMTKVSDTFKDNKDVVFLNINSNAAEKADSIKAVNEEYKIKTTTLVDADGTVGKFYEAKTTPHTFVIGKDGKLAYAGAYSNAPMGKVEGEGPAVNYAEAAVNSLLKDEPVKVTSSKSWGCGVKYAK